MTPPIYIPFFGKRIYAFHFFGVLGYLVGLLGGVWLAAQLQLAPLVILLLGAGGIFMFFFQAMATKIFTGEETLVYYRHEIGILVFSVLLLQLFGYPVLPYLEINLLGIGAFLAFGRIGCFSVGCCYGIPSAIGVCYNHAHKAAGFPDHLENIPLLPVQLLESAWVATVVVSGACLLLTGAPAGTALGLYTILYGAYRILIEFLRWDGGRPTLFRLSEAQWTTGFLIVFLLISEWNGWIPFHGWHFIVAAALVPMVLILRVVIPKHFASYKVTSPEHFEEIANFVKQYLASSKINTIHDHKTLTPSNINVFKTSKGLNISGGKVKTVNGVLYHLALSYDNKSVDDKLAIGIADFIKKIILSKFEYTLEHPNKEVAHLLFVRTEISPPILTN